MVGLASAFALVALLAAGVVVHYRHKTIAAVADAKPLQEGEEREVSMARDSTNCGDGDAGWQVDEANQRRIVSIVLCLVIQGP